MDVGEWLRSLDLGQYEATLRDNEIDVVSKKRFSKKKMP
jgi:SAM domain (Sterile alpha motif)